jgi:hypothetical protein
VPKVNHKAGGTSLTIPLPTNAAGMPMDDPINQEMFYDFLEQEMKKIEMFTRKEVFEMI